MNGYLYINSVLNGKIHWLAHARDVRKGVASICDRSLIGHLPDLDLRKSRFWVELFSWYLNDFLLKSIILDSFRSNRSTQKNPNAAADHTCTTILPKAFFLWIVQMKSRQVPDSYGWGVLSFVWCASSKGKRSPPAKTQERLQSTRNGSKFNRPINIRLYQHAPD